MINLQTSLAKVYQKASESSLGAINKSMKYREKYQISKYVSWRPVNRKFIKKWGICLHISVESNFLVSHKKTITHIRCMVTYG